MPEELTFTQIKDLQFASSKMTGVRRRAFQAEIAIKYCEGSARLTEYVFGWGRNTVATGLAEKRTGIICVGAQSGFGGNKRWEERYPEAAGYLQEIAQEHGQQDPSFTSSIVYTRLTAAEAIKQLQTQGYPPEQIPAPSTMADILNRMGYRLRNVVKAKPKKSFRKQTQFSRTSKAKTAKGNLGSNV
jgi:hypothetical protein